MFDLHRALPRLLLLVLLQGCATTFDRVQAARTLDEARAALRGEAPTAITPYPPNAEAWYFGWQRCVLFVDGKKRLVRTMEETGVAFAKRGTVDCSPAELKE
jgi:hypothetical protein